jgi:hypothetical protein
MSSVLTALLALLVFLEARSIQQTEWLTKSTAMWQDFNALLVSQPCRADSWREFLGGQRDLKDCTPSDLYIVFTYVNIIFAEWTYWRQRLLDDEYSSASLCRNMAQLSPGGEALFTLLESTGYEPAFVNVLRNPALNLSESRLSSRRLALGKRFRVGPPNAGHAAAERARVEVRKGSR